MGLKSSRLARRDPAMIALMGATIGAMAFPSNAEADFGAPKRRGAGFGSPFGNFGSPFGADDPAAVAAATLPASHPVNQALMKIGKRPMNMNFAPPAAAANAAHPAFNMSIPTPAALAAVHPAVAAAAMQGNPAAIAAINSGSGGADMNAGNPNAMAAWQAAAQAQHQDSREAMLYPNKYSTTKVERYGFAVNQLLTLGTTTAFTQTNNPDVTIRPQRVTANAPAPGFVTLTEIKVKNVSVIVGGEQDAYDYNANAVDSELDLPTLTPANRASISGTYSGFVPPGYTGSTPYKFAVSLRGPATMDD